MIPRPQAAWSRAPRPRGARKSPRAVLACALCPATFPSATLLQRHYDNTHFTSSRRETSGGVGRRGRGRPSKAREVEEAVVREGVEEWGEGGVRSTGTPGGRVRQGRSKRRKVEV